MAESLAGELVGNGHRLFQRVYYEDTDFSGVVYHARYLHFLERGRTDYLRCLGINQSELANASEGKGLAFVVYHMDIGFRGAARMDDVIEILTEPKRATGVRFVLDQTIRSGDRMLIKATVTVAIVDRQGRLTRLPEDVAARFGL
ncbi:tol-pal system-associated acyl-CoA thioesterase [Hoeflea prorocentri]|uniref:Tol-pal system-associated acyl-CoA thioesterase n=1 Tax=Hoeflea prorocentri TaxID=1922333 RepID=A0A9X3UIM5_9HYPH|nr:tol-pal system-associated acyl-CoA thioesterase [Hoeflea prorocentri]MCY6379310.1 tol-pal system-associated acyl-CoA thioesterase [Hoeflea prorocentri]MDA5397111.1 tol-pal system-associated acyl-CoA thioesterase [Hoeflea prorocentri]